MPNTPHSDERLTTGMVGQRISQPDWLVRRMLNRGIPGVRPIKVGAYVTISPAEVPLVAAFLRVRDARLGRPAAQTVA